MPADRDVFLASIRANPDDDAPRLVFADWLDDRGETDFASLIRLEVERDRLPPDDPRREPLHKRAFALRKAFPGDVSDLAINAPTQRGFHSSIMTGVLALRAGLDRLGPYAPRPTVLISANGAADQAARAEAASGGPDRLAGAFREIFASPWVRSWDSLELQSIRLTADWVRWLTEPRNLTGLRQLVFAGGLDDDAVRVLAGADLPRLRVLAVHEVRERDGAVLTPAAVAALGRSPLLARVEHLSLMGEWIGDAGLRALAESPRLTGLKHLHLWTRDHTPAGLRALFASPHLAGLKRLDIPWLELNPRTAAVLARPETLPALTRLNVRLRRGAGRTALARRFGDGLVVEEDEP